MKFNLYVLTFALLIVVSLTAGTFVVEDTRLNFTQASHFCQSKGMHLATPKTAEEQTALKEAVKTSSVNRFWIGLERLSGGYYWNGGDPDWTWVDNTPLGDYHPWMPGQPDHYNYEELCVEFRLPRSGQDGWNDGNCKSERAFVCQTPGPSKKRTALKCKPQFELHGSLCYNFITELMTQPDAKNYCKRIGARLIEPRTDFEKDILWELGSKYSKENALWVGATHIPSKDKTTRVRGLPHPGTYIWDSDGKNISKEFWDPNAPFWLGKLHSCALFLLGGTISWFKVKSFFNLACDGNTFVGSRRRLYNSFCQVEPDQVEAPMVACYFTNWAQHRSGLGKYTVEDIDAYLCTDIIYAFAKIENKSLKKTQTNDEVMWSKMVGLKSTNPLLKIQLAVGGPEMKTADFYAITKSEKITKEFGHNAIKFLRERDFDGLDLHFERHHNFERINFTMLCRELYRLFEAEAKKTGKPRLLLTAAIPANFRFFNQKLILKKTSPYLDYVYMKAYDFFLEDFPAYIGHHSPLYSGLHKDNPDLNIYSFSQNRSMHFWNKEGVPKHKIVMGMATYGRNFKMAAPDKYHRGDPFGGLGSRGQFTTEAGLLAYYEACQLLMDARLIRQWMDDTKVPFAYGTRNRQWEYLGYDDVQSMKAKAAYILSENLAGVMFWTLDFDDFKHICGHDCKYPLINTMKQELGYNEPSCKHSVSGHREFVIRSTKLNFARASAACQRDGMHLATPKTAEAEKTLLEVANYLWGYAFWIGLKRAGPDKWKWVDNSPLGAFKNWLRNQPNDYNNREDCVEFETLSPSVGWNDVYCDEKKAFMCERSDVRAEISPTTSFDMMCYLGEGETYTGKVDFSKEGKQCKRWDSFKWYRENPNLFPDDELPENYCRNPNGRRDKPWCWVQPPDRYFYEEEDCDIPKCTAGGKFMVEDIARLTFLQAFHSCQLNAMHLATPKTAEEQTALSEAVKTSSRWEAVKKSSANKFWIGLLRDGDGGDSDWKWVDNTPLGDYHPWLPGQPDNNEFKELCVEFTLPNQEGWNTTNCKSKRAFVCQTPDENHDDHRPKKEKGSDDHRPKEEKGSDDHRPKEDKGSDGIMWRCSVLLAVFSMLFSMANLH